MKGAVRVLVLAAFCLGLFVLPVSAQKITGDITGNVLDQSGAAIPKATVTAENVATKLTRTAITSDTGAYRLTELPPGTYKLSASAPGFKTTVRDAVVATAQTTDSDFTLQVGEKAETITVEASIPLVEYNDTLNSYVSQTQVVDLPMVGRDFNSLLGITPGVQRQPGGGFLAVSINGNRPFNNNYLIDGMYNNDRYYGDSLVGQTGVLGVPATILPNDSIQELTVQQLPSAEYGIKGGAAINVTMKSGTNNFHGAAYGFILTDFGSAASSVTHAVTPIHNYQYGGNLGGPIIKDKTFFYVFYERQDNQSLSPYTLGVPTPTDVAAGRAIAEAAFGVAPGTPLPGDAVFSLFPVDPSGSINAKIPNIARGYSTSIKIDHKLNAQHSFSGRYYIGDGFQSAPTAGYQLPVPAGNALSLPVNAWNSVAPSRAQLARAGWTYTVSANKILESRFGWSRFAQIIDVNNKIDPKSLGLDTGPLDPLDFGVPYVYAYYVSYGYIGGVAGYPITTRPNQSIDQSEHFTWIKGSHTFKIGGNWQYAETFSIRNRARTSLSILNTTNPADSIAQILALRFDRATRSFGSTNRHIFQHTFGFYFQDEWKLTPRITISYGLRYEVSSALGESDKQGSNFDPVLGLVPIGPTMKALYDKDLNNFGPRAGLAWDVFGNGKTALRIGYALTYDETNFGAIHAQQASYFNGNRTGAFTNITQNDFSKQANPGGGVTLTAANVNDCFDTNPVNPTWVCGGSGGLAGVHTLFGANPTGAPPFNAFGVVRNFQTPMFHYYQVSVQQELRPRLVLTVSYIGSKGRELPQVRALNARPIGCRDPVTGAQLTTGTCARPFDNVFLTGGVPTFLQINQLTNDGESEYNSLQVGLRQEHWHGFTGQYNFTWGHCIDLGSNNRGGGSINSTPNQNPYNPRNNRGNCNHDVRRNFNAGVTYAVPYPQSWGRFGEGWEIGGVVTILDGRPYTATIGSRDHTGQDLNGNNRADCLSAPIYHPRDQQNYVESGAFAIPADNTIGSCGRNSLVGPGFAQVDANLAKTTRITEQVKFQFRWEVLNIFNHANYTTPTGNIRSGGFGVITSTPDIFNPIISQGGPRAMQWVFKLIF